MPFGICKNFYIVSGTCICGHAVVSNFNMEVWDLPCGHSFHQMCLLQYFHSGHSHCPYCPGAADGQNAAYANGNGSVPQFSLSPPNIQLDMFGHGTHDSNSLMFSPSAAFHGAGNVAVAGVGVARAAARANNEGQDGKQNKLPNNTVVDLSKRFSSLELNTKKNLEQVKNLKPGVVKTEQRRVGDNKGTKLTHMEMLAHLNMLQGPDTGAAGAGVAAAGAAMPPAPPAPPRVPGTPFPWFICRICGISHGSCPHHQSRQ